MTRLTLSVLVLVIVGLSLSEALRGAGPKKCCFQFNTKPMIEKRVIGYRWTHQQCSNRAVLLKTKFGNELCANPSDAWVEKLISRLNSKALAGQVTSV